MCRRRYFRPFSLKMPPDGTSRGDVGACSRRKNFLLLPLRNFLSRVNTCLVKTTLRFEPLALPPLRLCPRPRALGAKHHHQDMGRYMSLDCRPQWPYSQSQAGSLIPHAPFWRLADEELNGREWIHKVISHIPNFIFSCHTSRARLRPPLTIKLMCSFFGVSRFFV